MTDHSIKELRRQYDAAQSALAVATQKKRLAENALKSGLAAEAEAKFAALGITKGTRVVSTCGGKEGIYVGHIVKYLAIGAEPIVRKIKKDGTAHGSQSVQISFRQKWEKADD